MNLYEKYHICRADERLQLFEILRSELDIESGLYPGCFVHVTPSFVIPRMVYVDSDARARRFFDDGSADPIVQKRKLYAESVQIKFVQQHYAKPLPIDEESIDLLISQYAGFVSESCTRYLKPGGYLVANNSHGDAGFAHCDSRFELIAVINRRGERYSLKTDNLDRYFIAKSQSVPSERQALRQYLKNLGQGIGYTRSAADYVFRKKLPTDVAQIDMNASIADNAVRR